MQLRDVQVDDVEAYVRMRCDPVMMADLSGPLPMDGMPDKVRRDAEAAAKGDALIKMVMLDDVVAGSVVLWVERPDDDELPHSEIGWMILPEFQGRGLATRAVRMVLTSGREQMRWGMVHATPSVTNAASNRLCAKLGFRLLSTLEREWAGRVLTVNDWRIDLGHASSEEPGPARQRRMPAGGPASAARSAAP